MLGKFISLEGMDGAGKTTVLNLVGDWLAQQGHAVLMTREPGGTPLAEEIRQLLLTPREEAMHPDAELMLMVAARVQHVRTKIEPALAAGQWVVSDRFFDASYAYQGGGRGLDMARIARLHDWAIADFSPDLTLLLDVPVALGKARVAGRGEAQTRFEDEQMAFYERVRQAYLARAEAEPQRMVVIDASQTPEGVAAQVRAALVGRWG